METVSETNKVKKHEWSYLFHSTGTTKYMLKQIKSITGESFASILRRLILQEYEKLSRTWQKRKS